MAVDIKVHFGRAIRHIRQEQTINQEEAAERCGPHRTYYFGVERGIRIVSPVNIEKIARGLRTTLPELFQRVRGIDLLARRFSMKLAGPVPVFGGIGVSCGPGAMLKEPKRVLTTSAGGVEAVANEGRALRIPVSYRSCGKRMLKGWPDAAINMELRRRPL